MMLPQVLRLSPVLPHVCALHHRYVSQKFIRPFPRSYRRRLYEAVVKPVLPKELVDEQERLTKNEVFAFHKPKLLDPFAYTPYELAEVQMIKAWIREEEFRLLTICHRLVIDDASVWLAANQFRLKGVELKTYNSKILRKLFEGTPFDSLQPLLIDRHLFTLFAKEPESLKTVVSGCAKYNWIVPLAMGIDDRLLSMQEVEGLAKLASLEDIRAETTQLLAQVPQALTRLLDAPAQQLVNTLDHIASAMP